MTDHERGIEQFTKYFVRNYPGPDTVIFDPKWHAPKIFRAAISAYLATTEPSKPVAEAVKVKPLEWQEQSDSSGEMSYWGHHQFGVYAVNRDYFSVVPWELLAGGRVIGNYDTVEAAKAAAQSYYEQRILSALAPQAGDNEGEPVAWMQGTFVTTNYNNVRFDEEVSGSGKYTPLYTHPSTLKDPGNVGDGGTEIIECLAAGKPFVFDPATNFLHADDGGAPEYGIKYVPVASHPCTSTPVDEEPKP